LVIFRHCIPIYEKYSSTDRTSLIRDFAGRFGSQNVINL
jgi:hypothetical protein